MFHALGVSQHATTVYLHLLDSPDSDISLVAAALGLTEPQVRTAVDELVRHSLAQPARAGQASPRLVRPEIALNTLLAREHAALADRQRELEKRRAMIGALLVRHAQHCAESTEPEVTRLDGSEAIRQRLAELAAACESEVSYLVPGGAQSPASMDVSRDLDATVLARGVRMRTVYLDSVRYDRPTLDYARWLGERGGEVRTTPTLPLRMLLVDRRSAVLTVRGDGSAASALVVSERDVLVPMVALFQAIWSAATPLCAAVRQDPCLLSPQEKHVLRLLSKGYTDEAVGRHLGVSPRTARRVSSTLMTRLGARSRFQAGARAAAQGLVEPDDLE